MTHTAAQAEPDDVRDAERYRWLRNRLEIRNLQPLAGPRRPGVDVRAGYAFLDSPGDPGKAYFDRERFNAECAKLDAAIDAAIAAQKDG